MFRRGDKAKAIYLLVAGQLKLYRSSVDGNEVIIDLIEPVATFAESRLFLEDLHFHVNCAALVDSEVAVIDRSTLLTLLRESSETCLLLPRQLSERAERHVDDIERLALQGSTCRVAGYLLGQLPPGRNESLLKVPKGVLATRLALRAETLSRVLKQLAEQGIVSVSGQNIVHLHSREKLQRLALQAAQVERH